MHFPRTENIVYMNLTANVEGEEAADPDETFITLGQEEFGAEFDQKADRCFYRRQTGF